jgi:dsRNA-specific ribonuclease
MLPQKVLDKKDSIFKYLNSLGINAKNIKDENLILQAFVHKSFAADFKKIQDHNERLEFL